MFSRHAQVTNINAHMLETHLAQTNAHARRSEDLNHKPFGQQCRKLAYKNGISFATLENFGTVLSFRTNKNETE